MDLENVYQLRTSLLLLALILAIVAISFLPNASGPQTQAIEPRGESSYQKPVERTDLKIDTNPGTWMLRVTDPGSFTLAK